MKRHRPNKLTTAIIIALIFSIFMACGDALAADWMSWDEKNTELHVPLTILYMVDMGQTLWAQEHYWTTNGAHEQNKLLGPNPSRGEIYSYFVASYALTTALVYALPKKYSHVLQGGAITMEIYVVNHNYNLGIGVNF